MAHWINKPSEVRAGRIFYRVLVRTVTVSVGVTVWAIVKARPVIGKRVVRNGYLALQAKKPQRFSGDRPAEYVRDLLGHDASVRAFRTFKHAHAFAEACAREQRGVPGVNEAIEAAQDFEETTGRHWNDTGDAWL